MISDKDDDKPAAWAYYASYAMAKYKATPIVLVITRDAKTASWAGQLHPIGLPDYPCLLVRPLTIGPDDLPAITDFDQACADLTLAVFSALVHAKGPNAASILKVLSAALATTNTDRAAELASFTEAGLRGTTAIQIWSTLMSMKTFDYQTELERAGEAKGEARGEAKGVLRILDRRGVALSDEDQARISTCTDLDVLDHWLDRAFEVTTAEELFS